MKHLHALHRAGIAALLVAALCFTGQAWAQSESGKKDAAGKAGEMKAAAGDKATYLVISPHTKEECLGALDAIQAQGGDLLARYDFGCMAGDHTGYLRVQADSEADALKNVPSDLRGKAKAIKVGKFTAEQIKQFHEMAH